MKSQRIWIFSVNPGNALTNVIVTSNWKMSNLCDGYFCHITLLFIGWEVVLRSWLLLAVGVE